MNKLSQKEQDLVILALARRKLELYRPYPKQMDFHKAGAKYRERLLMAGNQLGKTYCAAAEVAMHATGKYPDWWQGKRFKKAPLIWCAGVTGEVVRDTIQRLLIGDVANPGTGLIPPLDIVETMPSRGVADLVDTILVKHVSGGTSRIRLKYYEQGREKFQADTVDYGWEDEEPPDDIHTEFLTRTNATNGILAVTFTPLKGMSKVVKRFVREKSPDRIVVSMGIDDALHISKEKRDQIINSYQKHEREARIYGKPIQGSGLIFPVSREDISCEPFDLKDVPFYWQELAGIDFAGSGEDGHPTAAVRILYNPQDDIVYVTNTYRRKGGTPMVHGAALKPWGNVPFAWPHDGLQHDKGSGVPLKDLYANEGLNMLPDNARFDDGSNGVEAGIAILLQRMETGRLKIFSHLTDLFEEIDSYYRDEGKIIKVDEDLVCACLHPDTEVITYNGTKSIKDLVDTNGYILTINGEWAYYGNCRKTRVNAELVEVTYNDGYKLLCTPDHKLLSISGDWIQAVDSVGMVCHDAISNRGNKRWKILSIAEPYIRSIQKILMGITSARESDTCTELSMKRVMENRLMVGTSIISTSARRTTSFLTYLLCLVRTIWPFTTRDTKDTPLQDKLLSMSSRHARKAKNSTVSWERRIFTSCWSGVSLLVNVVERFLKLRIWDATDSALILVNPSGEGMQDLMMSRENVSPVPKHSGSINISKLGIALKVAAERLGLPQKKEGRTLVVSAVQTVNQRNDVYCMEVPATNAFALANGAIVHNCRYAIMCLRFAVRVRKPKGFIAEDFGTPQGDPYYQKGYHPIYSAVDELMGKK